MKNNTPKRRITDKTKIMLTIRTFVIIICAIISGAILYRVTQSNNINAIEKSMEKNAIQDSRMNILEIKDAEKQEQINGIIKTQTTILTNQKWIMDTLTDIKNELTIMREALK